jgi:riboflavin transporter FmnP
VETLNTKTVAAITVFTALTIVLNFSPFKIPAPYAPFLIYQIWEIPIVTAFLLFGAVVGILIASLNTVVLIAVYPGALPTGPLYNLAAVLSMLLGMGIVKVLTTKRPMKSDIALATMYTASGVFFRTVTMALVNWIFLRFPPPIGYSMPEEALVATIPLVTIFNITIALYTIPLGYALAKAVKSYAKTLT